MTARALYRPVMSVISMRSVCNHTVITHSDCRCFSDSQLRMPYCVYFVYCQKASSLLENFTEQYRNIMGNHEGQLVSTARNGVRRKLIFQAAVAFEEFVLRYGYYHLSKSKPDINNTNSKLCE